MVAPTAESTVSKRNDFARKQIELQFKAIEVVAAEGGDENAANLIVIARDFEFFGGAADGQVVHEDLRLVERAVGDAGQLAKFKVAEMLDADPDADAQHREHQPSELPVGHSRNKLSMAKTAETP